MWIHEALCAFRSLDVLRLVLAHGSRLTSLGLVIGLAGAAALSRSLGGFLYGVTGLDPASYAAAALLFASVALLTAGAPRRAHRSLGGAAMRMTSAAGVEQLMIRGAGGPRRETEPCARNRVSGT